MRKAALFLLAFVVLVACRPIAAPQQSPSPLPRGIVSPLPRSVIPEPPDGLIAPDEVMAAGTIPAASLPPMRYKLYAPIMAHQKRYPCGAVPMAAELLRLMVEDAEQQRKHPRCDNAMVAIAQNRANDMVQRKYYAHFTPDGWGPNRFLKIAGCLPDGYPENGNSVESITLNYRTPLAAWEALKRSPGHRAHVLGTHPFWQTQTLIGVGWSGNEWGEVFVILTTEGCK